MPTRIIFIAAILLLWISLFYGCETEISLYPNTKFEEVLVYGILDCSSSSQIIKVGRIGSPPTTDSHSLEFLLGIDPDTIDVVVYAWSGEVYGSYSFIPIKSDSSNSLMATYYGSFEPYEFMEYKLNVSGKEKETIASGKSLPLSDPKILRPGMNDMPIVIGDSLNFFEFKYSTVPRAMVYKLQMLIQYVEFTVAGDTLFKVGTFGFSPVYIDDPPTFKPTTINYGQDITRAFAPLYLQNIFARTIKEDPRVLSRVLYRIAFNIWAGDAVLRNYIQMAEKFDDNRKQYFSNISGGYGLFACCSHSSITGLRPDDAFLKMLATGYSTQNLNFKQFLWTGRNGWTKADMTLCLLLD